MAVVVTCFDPAQPPPPPPATSGGRVDCAGTIVRVGNSRLCMLIDEQGNVILSPLPARSNRNLAAVVADGPVRWASSNPDLATVNENGLVKPVGPNSNTGTVTIRGIASVNGQTVSGTITLTVEAAPTIAQVDLTTDSSRGFRVRVGQAPQLFGSAKDASGNSISGVSYSWTSSDPTKATVFGIDGNGTVTGVAPGTATISATASNGAGSTTGSVTVTVDP